MNIARHRKELMETQEFKEIYEELNSEFIADRHNFWKEHYEKNKSKQIARNKKYRENNREKVNEYQRKYRQKHLEKLRKYGNNWKKKWDLANPERSKEIAKKYILSDKGKLKRHNYYLKHRDEILEKMRQKYNQKKGLIC
jgi:hypothetical protein